MAKSKIFLCVLVLAATPAFAQSDSGVDARRAAVHELFVAREQDKITAALIESIADNYIAELARTHPETSQQQLALLHKNIEKNLTATEDDYLKHQVDLMCERLSLDDIHAATAFYQTPAGKRMADIAVAMIPEAGKDQMAWEYAAVHKAFADLNTTAKPSK